MAKRLTQTELAEKNIIAVRIAKQDRNYRILNGFITKNTNRIQYLKSCCYCGKVYESRMANSITCGIRCKSNLGYRFKKLGGSLFEMQFSKKDIKEIKERMGY